MRLFLAIVLAGIPAALLPSPARAQVTPASYQAASQSTQAPQAVPADCAELPALKERFERAEKRLMDWPELARYRDANTTLPPPSAKENRVVGKPYVDRGISGQTTPQMLIRFLPDVIALHPKVVVILAGTNDIAGNTGPMTLNEIEGNLSLMDELAHSNHIRVVLASLLPVSDYEHNHEGVLIIQTKRRPPAEILELNKWMKQYASTHGDVYLDYFSVMVDDQGMLKQDLSNDGLHPNAKGYAVMAPLAEQAIQAALKKKR